METKMFKRTLFSAFLIATFVMMGCSGKYKVTGKVLFEDDDSPVTLGVISFYGDGVVGSGRINPDGSFSVGVKTETDGIPKGEYGVTITAMDTVAGKNVSAPGFGSVESSSFVSQIDTKYGTVSRSGLTATVPSKEYIFRVERAK